MVVHSPEIERLLPNEEADPFASEAGWVRPVAGRPTCGLAGVVVSGVVSVALLLATFALGFH